MSTQRCDLCTNRHCTKETWEKKELPMFCPMRNKQNVIEKALEKYKESDNRKIYNVSAVTEQNAYMMVRGRLISVRPRLLEIIKFSEGMGWKKIGIAFCGGLMQEAKIITKILEDSGLELNSIVCSCGGVDKSRFGVKNEHKIANHYGEPERFEAGCNPIVQAEVLNSENLDLHIIVGLCIGHDITFTKYSKTFVTTLMVKDRVTGHNPMASIYSAYHNPRYYTEEN